MDYAGHIPYAVFRIPYGSVIAAGSNSHHTAQHMSRFVTGSQRDHNVVTRTVAKCTTRAFAFPLMGGLVGATYLLTSFNLLLRRYSGRRAKREYSTCLQKAKSGKDRRHKACSNYGYPHFFCVHLSA